MWYFLNPHFFSLLKPPLGNPQHPYTNLSYHNNLCYWFLFHLLPIPINPPAPPLKMSLPLHLTIYLLLSLHPLHGIVTTHQLHLFLLLFLLNLCLKLCHAFPSLLLLPLQHIQCKPIFKPSIWSHKKSLILLIPFAHNLNLLTTNQYFKFPSGVRQCVISTMPFIPKRPRLWYLLQRITMFWVHVECSKPNLKQMIRLLGIKPD